jgi:UTP--glucose-1-phosphate uridylyltransferase
VFTHLSKHETGAGGEIQLTDALDKLIAEQPFNAMRFDGKTHDSGSRIGFITANIAYGLSDPEIQGELTTILEDYLAQIKDGKNAAAAE